MTAHRAEYGDLRVGCRVTLRDWRGEAIGGEAFLSPAGAWLARTRADSAVPITPRELVAVENGAAAMYARLQEGASVTLDAWDGSTVRGIAVRLLCGDWCCKDATGARWLIEPYRLVSVMPREG